MADLLSKQSLTALGFVATLVAGAFISAETFLPKSTTTKARVIFTWLAFDSLTHFLLEGSFLYYSINGRTIDKTTSFLAYLWQDYARADTRWGTADATVVSLEFCESFDFDSIQGSETNLALLYTVTVLGCGPIAAYCCYCLIKNNPAYHFWAVVLSVSELYGGFMTFCPEWLTGNKVSYQSLNRGGSC